MLRLRCKIYEEDGKQYLAASGLIRIDDPNHIRACMMSDEKTFHKTMSLDEWNALPFHWFEDQGPAPRPAPTLKPGFVV